MEELRKVKGGSAHARSKTDDRGPILLRDGKGIGKQINFPVSYPSVFGSN